MAKRPRNIPLPAMAGHLAAGLVALILTNGPACGATAITIGRTNPGTISNLPVYLAAETGLFREEGLDVRFVTLSETALVTAGLGGVVDFVPLARAGAHAALKGAPVRFVVGQSILTPSALIAGPGITSVAELKDGLLGFGQKGQRDYRDGETVLREGFGLVRGKDYRAVAIPGEKARFATLERGGIQAGLFSLRYAAKAQALGYSRLFRTGAFLPRLTGTVWVREPFLRTRRDTVRRFIRAIARAADVIHTDAHTTVMVIQKHLRLHSREEAKLLWHSVRDTYTANIPARLLADLFRDGYRRLQRKGAWPRNKGAPRAEAFMARTLLTETLKRTEYIYETSDVIPRVADIDLFHASGRANR